MGVMASTAACGLSAPILLNGACCQGHGWRCLLPAPSKSSGVASRTKQSTMAIWVKNIRFGSHMRLWDETSGWDHLRCLKPKQRNTMRCVHQVSQNRETHNGMGYHLPSKLAPKLTEKHTMQCAPTHQASQNRETHNGMRAHLPSKLAPKHTENHDWCTPTCQVSQNRETHDGMRLPSHQAPSEFYFLKCPSCLDLC